jgi:predicted RNA-binding Zn ribbon-like protein
MSETPTAASMRLDGGHPALELVNTVYGQVDGPVEHDVLATPADLVTLARRLGLAGRATPPSAAALAAARTLRDAVDALLRARLASRYRPAAAAPPGQHPPAPPAAAAPLDQRPPAPPEAVAPLDQRPPASPTAAAPPCRRPPATHGAAEPPAQRPLAAVEAAARAAIEAARLTDAGGVLAWSWREDDASTPVHRLAIAAVELLADAGELARLHECAGCRWLFLDHSRGAGRRWCSMADCGTEAKKRRYVQRRRERRRAAQS